MVCGMTDHALDALLLASLGEDAPYGDKTTEAMGINGEGRGAFVAKEPLVVCGLPAALRTFVLADSECRCQPLKSEGEEATRGDILAEISGPIPALLLAERVSLNLLQRMCGIATMAREATRAAASGRAKVCDTRKTTPLYRSLEKYAVRTGGAHNHRMGLSDAILIKDNHIAAAGSVAGAVRRARAGAGPLWKIEVEVTDLEGFREAVSAGAEVILLDNMDDGTMARIVAERPPGVLLEASGGMTLGRIPEVSRLGVDYISVGALTHSFRACDISLELGTGATA